MTNQQEMYARKVRAAGCIGAFLSFFVGACIAPFVGTALLWVIHWLGWAIFGSPSPGIFHGLPDFIAAPNWRVGLFWLLYYVVSYLWAKGTHSPRQKAYLEAQAFKAMNNSTPWRAKTRDEEEEEEDEWADPLGLATPVPSQKGKPVLSRATPGEVKHQLVERCYQEYQKALLRYDPPPVALQTPPTFYYAKGVRLGWNKQDRLPILPEELLAPERIHLLLAPLAYHLTWYNLDEPSPQTLRSFPDYVPWWGLLIPTGNFLWVPVAVKHHLEVPAYLQEFSEDLREKVYQALQFTCYLGQGSALEHQYRRLQAELGRRGMEDRSFPTLNERIGYLEVLNSQEREQMRQLGLTPKEPPLVKGDIPLQLYPGKTGKQER